MISDAVQDDLVALARPAAAGSAHAALPPRAALRQAGSACAAILRGDLAAGAAQQAGRELARRRAEWRAPEPAMRGGYQSMYIKHVTQADEGADLDFLVGCRGSAVPRESH
ncbi:MAG: hypothetical protein RR376_09620 [Janthinobacterium sp.]